MDQKLSEDPDALRLHSGWLAMQGITTFAELCELTQNDLLTLPYSSRARVEQITAVLDERGIKHRLREEGLYDPYPDQ